MIRISFLAMLLLMSSYVLGQMKPGSFALPTDKNMPAKVQTANPASNSINDILVVGDTIWLATSRGLSKSIDNGTSWVNYYGDNIFGTESVTALAYDYATHTIWASTAHSTEVSGQSLPEGSGVRVSADGGTNWKVISQPLDAATDTLERYGNNTLKALPVTVRIQNIIYDLAVTPHVIWAASFAGGLRKNNIDSLLADPARPWKRVVLPPDNLSRISPKDTALDFCISPVAGKYCSMDNYNYRVFSLAVLHDTILYAGTADGINYSYDTRAAITSNNLTWQKTNYLSSSDRTISGNFVVALEANNATNTVYAATWKANGLTETYGVSYSYDRGLTWTRTLPDERVHNFASYRNIALALSDNGPHRSFDLGLNWSTPGVIIDSDTRLALKTDVFYSGAFSKNGQRTWLGSTEGLIAQDGLSSGWGSKWKLFVASQPLTSKNDSYVFPSPFSPKTDVLKIKYSTGGVTAPVTIRIFNFAMKPVRTLIQNAQRGNTIHQIETGSGSVNGVVDHWDGKDDNGTVVPNGVYFYRIDVGSADPMYGKILVIQ